MTLWQRGRVTLAWSDKHELHGLEVVMRRKPMGEFLDDWLAEGDEATAWDDLSPKERAIRTRRNAEDLAGLIVSWNLADDDEQPVPVGADSVLAHCDTAMINAMRDAYQAATTRVPPPLPESSTDGSEVEVPEDWGPAQEVLTTS